MDLVLQANNKYRGSYLRMLSVIFYNIKSRCGNVYNNPKSRSYRNVKLLFGKDEFIQWGTNNKPYGIEEPSIGRLDHSKDYSLDNIEWQELNFNIRNKGRQENISKDCYVCIMCKDELPRTSEFFYRNSCGTDNLQNTCKICQNVRRTIYYRRKGV